MRRETFVLVAAAALLLLSACADVRVYSPTDTAGTGTGNVEPLADLAKQDFTTLTVVFVHGMGDYCRGYAVGDEKQPSQDASAWLSSDTLAALRMKVVRLSQRDTEITAAELHVGGADDGTTNVVLIRERDYLWSPPNVVAPLKVHAVEVTWSPLTRWIKNTLLGFDASQIAAPFSLISGGNDIDTCRYDQSDTIGQETPREQWFPPPARVAISANIKWQVLDRSLTDAIIYAGSYGQAIERGVGAALCRTLGGRAVNEQPCVWPTVAKMRTGQFIFITHSLGSRILYDTLDDLSSTQGARSTHANPFSSADVQGAEQVILKAIERTAGFYMMANQLPMFGAANVPVDAPFNQQSPYNLKLSSAERVPEKQQANSAAMDPLVRLLGQRSRSKERGKRRLVLRIVSFNDTNDLLTWHLPAWYVTTAGDNVQIADVFVKNALRWFWLLEWPRNAHTGYFENKKVWEVMFCGAKKGKVTRCLH